MIWLNTDDKDVDRYLRYFSFRSEADLAELAKATSERPAAREAQRALAAELTTLVHGEAECQQAIRAAQALFGRAELTLLSPQTLAAALPQRLVEVAPRCQVQLLDEEPAVGAVWLALAEAREGARIPQYKA